MKYIDLVRGADEQCKRITAKALDYALAIQEINSSNRYSIEYKEQQRKHTIDIYASQIESMVKNAIDTVKSATEDAEEQIKVLEITPDLSTALQIIKTGNMTTETQRALSDVFRGRRQCQLILNSALKSEKLEQMDVYNPITPLEQIQLALEPLRTQTNIPDIMRILEKAQGYFNDFYKDSNLTDKAEWNLPTDNIKELKMREVMGIMGKGEQYV